MKINEEAFPNAINLYKISTFAKSKIKILITASKHNIIPEYLKLFISLNIPNNVIIPAYNIHPTDKIYSKL